MARARWTVLVAGLLLLGLLGSVVPVLAADAPPPDHPPEVTLPPASTDEDLPPLPDADDLREGREAVEEEEAERELWLESPEALLQREESRHGYAGIGAADAKELLRSVFTDQFAARDGDPGRFLSDAQLVRPLGEEETAATVQDEGKGSLLDAGVPVRAENEQGELRKVDLSLEAVPGGFEPANPLTPLHIPASAAEPVEIGEEGLAVSPVGVAPGDSAQLLGDKDVYYHGVLEDAGMVVSPVSGGVELFNILFSEESPETLRYELDLPDGAELRSFGGGGAEVVRDGETLATIPPPTAVDAQGTPVPVEMAIEGSTLALHVAHREEDFAWPIMVDPAIWENWYTANWFNANANTLPGLVTLAPLTNGAWQYAHNYGFFYGSTWPIFRDWGGSHRGLFVSTPNQWMAAGTWGRWAYSAPNIHSYIEGPVSLLPYWVENHGCSKPAYPQPDDYVGLWGDNSWIGLRYNDAFYQGYSNLDGWGRSLSVGLTMAGAGVQMPCWRDLYVGGALIKLNDWAHPTLNWVSGVPSGWFGVETPITVTANASDAGLGVQYVTITQEKWGKIDEERPGDCTGLYNSRCPTNHSVQFDFTALSLGEGIRTLFASAHDPTGKGSNSYERQTMVDRSEPRVTLDGQLAEVTEEDVGAEQGDEKAEKLVLPVYNLKIETTDGNPNGEAIDKRSGVKDIAVFLDDQEMEVPWSPQGCAGPKYSCPMNVTYPLILSDVEPGEHTLKVFVYDQVGNFRERSIEFEYFPATGMKDEYVMHRFPLSSGEKVEGAPAAPELAVNVMNGNLVYRETDVEIDGTAGVDLEVERYYNSMLPDSANGEWGDGWTLAQAPELEPIKAAGSLIAGEAEILDSSGALEGVELPTAPGAERFDPVLQATLTKKPSGGYELRDETGESATEVSFDQTGQTEALLTDGYAKVDYGYEGGELAEIEVSDPATFAADPAELEIPEPELITAPTFSSSFSSWGSADGFLKSPGDVAIDQQRNLWVLDKGNNRVQKFDSSGKFLAKFGSSGSGDGQFNRPTAIAIAANGDLLIADAGNGRVQRFSSTGAFISKFGSSGTGNGQFNGSGPEGVAVDGSGNVWVSDTYGGRLQKFNPAGEFLTAVGSKGSGPGQLGEPTGIDVDPSGKVWVADWQNHRVSIFNSAGEFLSSFGTMGTGDGQFRNPDEIEIDKLGNVWVGDQTNSRIQQFDLAAQFKAKFGSAGTGPGQFFFAYPMGIAADSKGHLWIADVNNHRIQRWLVPIESPAYISAFGSAGAGNSELRSPPGVEVGVEGNIWVIDRGNHRIKRFDRDGNYLSQFGSLGTGEGQFDQPTAIAIDRDGNLLITDSHNDRVQKFTPQGEFVWAVGSGGAGEGQLQGPEGIATDHEGNIWVADTQNGRIQKFDEDGNFLAAVSSKGTEPGQLGRPLGIDLDPDGNIWVADWANRKVSVFAPTGVFITRFGSQGTGPGQFNRPSALEIDSRGNVWVGDQGNARVQRFDLSGQYVGQFGKSGSAEGQFSLSVLFSPMGIAAERDGGIWVTDFGHSRIQRWQLGHYAALESEPTDLTDGDARVDVETEEGLVRSVTGNAAGEHDYAYDGDFLVSHDGPGGETTYENDEAGRLTKVTLPDGTWAEIEYEPVYGRVISVKVDPAGPEPEKATEFDYTDAVGAEEARRTTVEPEGERRIFYDIGADGSVLRWRNSLAPPVLNLAGTLYDNREGNGKLFAGEHLLEAHAYHVEGITSIEVIVGGNVLVDELHCDPQKAVKDCEDQINFWMMETGSNPPGHLSIEVIATDRLGGSTSERFWVDVPEPPPPLAPGTPIPPKFNEIAKFREEYGLEVVFPVADEIELTERILDLITAWWNPQTPKGEVARASYNRWGVPLRPADVAELEYREWFYEVNAGKIDQWVEATNPGSYAGYYMDHPAGGVMRIGFLGNQTEQLANLETSLSLVGGSSRLSGYPTPPTTSYLAVRAAAESVMGAMESNPTLRDLIVSVEDDEAGKATRVGTPHVAQVKGILDQMLGANAPVTVEHQAGGGAMLEGRFRNEGRMRAGDYINGAGFWNGKPLFKNKPCTAGFGALDPTHNPPRVFLLTAGHCYTKINEEVWRAPYDENSEPQYRKTDEAEVGKLARNAIHYVEPGPVRTDGAAIRIHQGGVAPIAIWGWEGHPLSTQPAGKARKGNIVCYSGAISKMVACGQIVARSLNWTESGEEEFGLAGYWVRFPEGKRPQEGDSGAPVWNRRTGASIGLVSAGRPDDSFEETLVAPLLHPPNMAANRVPGILHHVGMATLQLKLGG